MLIYIVIFVITIIATFNAQRCSSGTLRFYVHSFFAIVPLTLLAAFRDYNVGTDTGTYILIYKNATQYSNKFMSYAEDFMSVEKVFLLYNYIISQISTSIELYYIISYGLIYSLVYTSAIKLKNIISPHIFILIFLFLFFGETLNIMRQYIAISIILYGISDLIQNKKYVVYILCTLIGLLFHSSAIVSIICGLLFFCLNKYPLGKYKILYTLICLFVVFALSNIEIVLNLGFIESSAQERYNSYINKDETYISISHIAIYLVTLLYLLSKHKDMLLSDFFLIMAVFAFIFTFLGGVSSTFTRIATYFTIISCFSIAHIYKLINLNNTSKSVINILLIIYVYYFFFAFVINGTSEVVPYSSKILGL